MSERKRNDPLQYDFDTIWDVEQALFGDKSDNGAQASVEKKEDVDVFVSMVHSQSSDPRRRERQTSVAPVQRSNSNPPRRKAQSPSRMPEQPARAPVAKKKKRKKKVNYKGLAILGAMALIAILVIYLLIRFFVWVLSPGEGIRGETTVPTTTVATEPTTTVDYDALAEEVLAIADRQAAMYDYDAAIATLKTFGNNWAQRPELSEAKLRYEELKSLTVRWADTTTIPHVFFHSLIADNSRAFDGQYTEDGYNQYMTTISEFEKILEEMYARGYVLVKIHDIAQLVTDENGKQVYRQGDIYLPEGKKPFVMSQDDVNYYEYMVDSDGDHLPDAGGDGFAHKLLVGTDGRITCEYITKEGQTVYGDYDLVPILETFIEKHPDFSYRGAKAIVALTGYEGVYGYRTDKDGKERLSPEDFQKEIDGAKEVTAWLLENGWEISSHSYGHPAYGNISAESLAKDVARWEEEVQPVVGDTDIILYPFGSDIAGIGKYSGEKYDTLYAAGYRFFCNVDSSDYWVQIRDNYVRQGRRNLDGYRMWYNPGMLDDLFDVENVFDPDRPTPVPPI